MTNEKDLLEKAIEQAMETALPEKEEPKLPRLYEKVRFGFNRNLKANSFPVGQKSKLSNLPKLDASGEAVKLPNGGQYLVKDYSTVKFWHEGKLISKAEHDELTNGVK